MASATTKPEKRLEEFLKEQQEPFILELYLLEKGYSKKCKTLETPANSKRKPLFPFLKVLHKKLGKNSDTRNKHTNVGVPHEDQTVVETDRFSTASSSTMFNSCSDIDDEEERTSFSPHTCQSHQATNNGKHRQRCIQEQRITEDSLLSAALWSSLIQTAKRENYTKKVLQMEKTKLLLFDCVKEMTINRPWKDDRQQGYKQFMGPEKLGKIIWEKTKEWSQRATGNETNMTKLLNFDCLDSMNEWSEFKPQVRDISVEIADAILDRVNNEIVSEMMIQILPQNIVTN